eukprot:scaffold19170_cov16-Tisochrysis_lutea.AAC.1
MKPQVSHSSCQTWRHAVWPTSAEEKEEIVNNYKKRLSTIDCQYFAQGEGTCPFGSSFGTSALQPIYGHDYKPHRDLVGPNKLNVKEPLCSLTSATAIAPRAHPGRTL